MKKYLYIFCGLLSLQSVWAFDTTVFPTLAGLSRTVAYEFFNENCMPQSTYIVQPNKEVSINGKQYLEFAEYIYLREADNKVYIYSGQGTEDLVLYDYTLSVGDVLKSIKMEETTEGRIFSYMEEVTLSVSKIENITLLDGKEYKKWTFCSNTIGTMEYVETIGTFGNNNFAGDFFQIIQKPIPVCQMGNHLVCISRNGQLLYEMPQEEQERLHTHCMSKLSTIWANQWNVLKFHAYLGLDKEDAVIYEYTLSGDTTINNLSYTKVMQRATLTSDVPKYAAAIRQEGDKVYVCHDGKEYLLYDFGSKAGDEMMVWGGLDHPTTLCKNRVKDVQTTEDGKRILTIEIADYIPDIPDEEQFWKTAQWIEGIGSTHGLLYTGITYPGGSFHYLQCAYSNGVQVYERKDDYFAQFGCEYNSNHVYFPEGKVWSYRVTELCTDSDKTFIRQMNVSSEKTINGTKYMLLDDVPIRESGKQVFAYYEGKEVLIYDFGLKVGDKIISPSARLYNDNEEGLATVTAVDSVTLLDGRRAKRIQYDYRATDIEYVGSVSDAGVLAPLYGEVLPPCGPIRFICCSVDGSPIYETSQGSCEYNTRTAASNTQAHSNSATKWVRDGQILINRNGKTYNIVGVEM